MNIGHLKTKKLGFTLIELLISVAVVGILIAIITVSYIGVMKRAAGESIKSDLMAASTSLSKFKADRGVYPDTIRCDIPDSATNLCIKKSLSDIVLSYSVNTSTSPDTYGLTATKGGDNDISYRTVSGSEPIPCPVGYIVVPGSKTYNTSSFCVMKYEAKIRGNDNGNLAYNASFVPDSRAAGTPWVNLNQASAIASSRVACTGCHLINEAEWMTIAQDVLKVNSNWSGGTVGSGYIYNGHNDGAPNNAIAADLNDSDGYVNETNKGGKQRRTLTLTNGEVIWDLAGNVVEWTSAQVSGVDNQPGVKGEGYAERQWPAITFPGNLTIDPSPMGTGLSGANTWNSSNGIGKISSSTIDISLRGVGRGSWWGAGDFAGVLTIEFEATEAIDTMAGFRVSR